MHTQILRINYNHLKPYFAPDYLGYKKALDRCVVAVLATCDLLVQPLTNLCFEDSELQACWQAARAQPQHELMIQQLGLVNFRQNLEEMHEQVEVFLHHKYPSKAQIVFVHINLDATYHLCVQFRAF